MTDSLFRFLIAFIPMNQKSYKISTQSPEFLKLKLSVLYFNFIVFHLVVINIKLPKMTLTHGELIITDGTLPNILKHTIGTTYEHKTYEQ